MKFLVILLPLLQLIKTTDSAKILGFFGHPGKSHFDVFEPLIKELAQRGHDMTVVSFFPQKKKLANYTDISLEGIIPVYLNVVDFEMFKHADKFAWAMPYLNLFGLYSMAQEACGNILPSQQIKDLLNSKESYDLIITEMFNTDCFLGVLHKLNAPIVSLSSCTFMPWMNTKFANPSNPSYIPNVLYGHADKMSLLQRVHNTVVEMISTSLYYPLFTLPAERLLAQHVDPNLPPLTEIAKNTSLLLINTHFTMHRPRPLVPGIVEIGGLHIAPPKPIPEDMEEFINGSTHGVVLFSLGSMLRAETLDPAKRQAFIDAFKEIPQRVIWKFEKDLPGLPDNVKIWPWLPQRDILEHDNVKGFLAHGGLLGLTEAVHCGKPVLGIPMFGDQHTNIMMAQQSGMAVHLPYADITKQRVLDGLKQILNQKFYDRAQSLSRLYRDRVMSPLETAVFWTEYVLRHKGAPHLRSAAVDLNLFQYYLLDVMACLLVFSIISFHFLKTVYRLLRSRKSKPNTK